MKNFKKEEVIPLLRKLAKAFQQEKGFSESDISSAKTIATKLYVMHANREITLNQADFNLIVEIMEY